jgi:hypothetical protein
MAARREQLEVQNASYEKWGADTSNRRETAEKARTELEHRGLARQAAGHERQAEPGDEPQTVAVWWRQFEADLAAVDRAVEREHQAALTAGRPWPPEYKAQPEPASRPEPAAGSPGATESGSWTETPASRPEVPSDYQSAGQAARLDKLLAEVGEAAHGFAAENAGREARAEYAFRVEREARAEPELVLQAESPDEPEVEL